MPKQDPKPETPPAPDAAIAVPSDEFAGQGGSYLVDPATGRRTRMELATIETGTHFQKE